MREDVSGERSLCALLPAPRIPPVGVGGSRGVLRKREMVRRKLASCGHFGASTVFVDVLILARLGLAPLMWHLPMTSPKICPPVFPVLMTQP